MNRTSTPSAIPRFVARMADTEQDMFESLKLRYRVFAQELGAKIDTAPAGIDADRFDAHCRHLIVRDNLDGRMVASTRILTDSGAQAAGGFYSESEFDLSSITRMPGRKMEVGRTCVDPEFRGGAVIATLWAKLAETMTRERQDYLFGCASIGLEDGGQYAHAVMSHLSRNHFSSPNQRVRSRQPLPVADRRDIDGPPPRLPPLLKAYVSLGAKICGEGYWDQDFNCVDVFVLLNVANMTPRYARHFARASADAELARTA